MLRGKQTGGRIFAEGWDGVEVAAVPSVQRPDSEPRKASHLPDSFPSSLSARYPAVAWGPLTPAALSLSLLPLLLRFHYLSLRLSLPLSSAFSLQALFARRFQELPVSPG